MDSNFSFNGESSAMMCPTNPPAAFPGGGVGLGEDGRSNSNVNPMTLDPTDPAPAIHEPNKYDDGIVVQHAPAIHDPNKTFMSQQSDIVFNTNTLNNNSQHGGSPRGKVLRINSQDEVYDPSSIASVTSDRTRRSSTMYKEEDDTHQHGQTKPPVRKKGKTGSSDNRWSKRFTWPDALHRDFVSAIFDVGLKHASPSTIVEFMTPDFEITSERVKSHLQKYRMSRQKSRAEFMESYDACLDEYQNGHSQHPDKMLRQEPPKACGMTAAFLTHTAILHDSRVISQTSQRSRSLTMDASSNLDRAGILPLPLLTTNEKDGPIGQGFGYLVGLHQALSQQLDETRKRHQDMNSLNEQSRPQAHLQPVPRQHFGMGDGMGGSRDVSITSDPSGHEIVIPYGGSSNNNSYMTESQIGYAGMYSHQQPTPYHYQHYQGGADAQHQYANRHHSSSLSNSSQLSNSQHSMSSLMMASPVTGMTPMMTNLNVYTGVNGGNPPTIMLNDGSQQQQNNRNMYGHEPPIQPRQDPRRLTQESNIYC